MSEIAVLGIGNEQRADDAIGLLLTAELAKRSDPRLRCYQTEGNISTILDIFQKNNTVLLVDACLGGDEKVAETAFIDLQEKTLPAEKLQSSSHIIDISQTIELARNLSLLPQRLYLFAIYCNEFTLGAPMSKILTEKFIPIFNKLEEAIQCMSNR